MMRIEACFDSHVHWAATGEFSERLRLDGLRSADQILQVKPEARHYRGDWLVGFGWDENTWPVKPSRHHLDKWIADVPVALTRIDGHAIWLNTEAIRRSGVKDAQIQGGRVERDESGFPAGIVIDQACELIRKQIPEPTPRELRRHLLKAMQTFNSAGFTHIRDLTCDERQWNEAVHLDQSGVLTLAVEEYFWLKEFQDLQTQVATAVRARGMTNPNSECPNLRVKGLKLFLDGALGSEGALLSKSYCGTTHSGLALWDDQSLKISLKTIWEENLAVALHCIGDEAVDRAARIALNLKGEGIEGELHLEHVEILRPDTLAIMRQLTHLHCHLQPSQWLSDRGWLEPKVGKELAGWSFPWRRLQEAEIDFDFGSDAPIEAPSVQRSLLALRESADSGAVPRLLGSPISYMGHRDLAWAPNSYSIFGDDSVEVVFRGENI